MKRILFILAVFFFMFILLWERWTKIHQLQRLHEHAGLLENGLWTMDGEGVRHYLQLAARQSDYCNVKAFADTAGQPLAEIDLIPDQPLDRLFIRLGLIPLAKISAPVAHAGVPFGRIEVIAFRKTVYLYLYLLLLLGLSALALNYFLLTLHAKQTLETAVLERTRQLRENEAHLNTLIEALPALVWLKSPDGRYLSCNRRMEALFGRDKKAILGKTDEEFFETARAVSFRNGDVEAIAANHPIVSEEELTFADDRHRETVEMIRTTMFDHQGTLIGVLGIAHDITDRKRSEEALFDEKERLAVTLRSIGDGVMTTDTQGRILILNRAAEHLTGWMLNEAQGMPLRDVFKIMDMETRQACEDPATIVLRTGTALQLDGNIFLATRDGREIPVSDSCAPIRSINDEILGTVLVFRDITEKKKLFEVSLRADKLAALGVLAGGIAHDFNNLLGGFFNYVTLAKHHCTPDSPSDTYLEKALSVLTRAKGLSQQLLTFSRGGTPVRTSGLVTATLQNSTRFALSGSSISGVFDTARDLWVCEFDENQLGQVIDNLVINAVQAMPQGGKVRVAASNAEVQPGDPVGLKPGRYVHIAVTDTGTGIPLEIQSRIFDPFFTTKPQGSGLGLATAYSIVKKHEGEMTVESEPGKGAAFHLYLPASQKEPVGASTALARRHEGTGRVLVMDDEPFCRDTTKSLIALMGYEVDVSASGEETLAKIREATNDGRPFLAVIMDLTIRGGLGGKETIRRLRETDTETKVFVASGYSDDPIMVDPQAYGFSDRIAKPFRMRDLEELFARHFEPAHSRPTDS